MNHRVSKIGFCQLLLDEVSAIWPHLKNSVYGQRYLHSISYGPLRVVAINNLQHRQWSNNKSGTHLLLNLKQRRRQAQQHVSQAFPPGESLRHGISKDLGLLLRYVRRPESVASATVLWIQRGSDATTTQAISDISAAPVRAAENSSVTRSLLDKFSQSVSKLTAFGAQ